MRHDDLLYVYNMKWSPHSYKFIFFWWWEKSCSFSAFTAINLPLSTAAFGSYLWVFSNFPRDFFVDPVVDSFSHYLWIFQSSFHLWLHAIVVAEDTGLFSLLRLVLWPNTWSAVENVHLKAWVECRVCCSRCFLVDFCPRVGWWRPNSYRTARVHPSGLFVCFYIGVWLIWNVLFPFSFASLCFVYWGLVGCMFVIVTSSCWTDSSISNAPLCQVLT